MDQSGLGSAAGFRFRLIPHGEPLNDHTNWVRWGAWGQFGKTVLLATGSDDDSVRLWDPATGAAYSKPLTGHTDWVLWGAWGQVGETVVLATGGRDGSVRLWDPATGAPYGEPLTSHTGPVLWGASPIRTLATAPDLCVGVPDTANLWAGYVRSGWIGVGASSANDPSQGIRPRL